MKRSRIIAVALLLAAGGILLIASRSSPPRLTILINGNHAANITVTDYQAMAPRKTDSTGSITLEGDPGYNTLFSFRCKVVPIDRYLFRSRDTLP
jgi:hypothetical protein